MKIAIFHNFLDNIGGAEIVSLILARELSADIYTTNIDAEKIKKMGFENILPRIYSIGKVPLNAPFRQQMAMVKFRFLNLKNKYDFYIICGDWAMSGAKNNEPNLWYVHSPIREIWDLKDHSRTNLVASWQRPVFDLWVDLNRYLNKKYLKNVNKIVCNSQNTKNRIKKYLNREAEIIYPPVDTKDFHFEKIGDYWLSVNRLINHKRVDLQLKAFAGLPEEKLVIVGSYEKARHFIKYAESCNKIKPINVEIKSWISKKELVDLYANCKGFITTSHNEDFGMNVMEAMASGKPVIAPAEGGYLETVVNGKTGILIENIDKNKLVRAIKDVAQSPESYKNACIEQAQEFDAKFFIEKIKNIIGRPLRDS